MQEKLPSLNNSCRIIAIGADVIPLAFPSEDENALIKQ